jgi:hypothetical protein
MTSSMTNTSKGEGSQYQTKKHIERDSLLVRIRFECPLTTDSTIRNALSRRSIRSLRLSREVGFSVSCLVITDRESRTY